MSWRFRRWRARHYLWAADVDYRRWPTPAAEQARSRAAAYLARVEAVR